MTKTAEAKRPRLVATADALAYRQGFHRTTLAAVAAESGVPLGNVYYYFKTKDDLGLAMVERRLDSYRRQRARWDALADPRRRLLAFVRSVAEQRDQLAEYGCPIGSLIQELHKEGGPLADAASRLFTEFLDWIEEQFRLLGQGRRSRRQAVHLLAGLQGASLLANSFCDPALVISETHRLEDWIRSL